MPLIRLIFFGQMFSGFGGFGGGSRQRGPKKTKDVQHQVKVSLADLYKGLVKKMKVQRNIICDKCKGKGSSKEGAVTTCSSCNGAGMRVEVARMGNMITQRQAICDKCRGEGRIVPEKDKCETCSGQRVVDETKILNLEIQRGMQWGEAVAFYGEADQAPDLITGDLIFILQPKEDDCPFRRVNDDLYLDQTISLADALCGTKFALKHLDDREILLQYDQVISPGKVLKVPELGMPIRGQPGSFGNLFVKFEVEFPTTIANKQKLLEVLPKSTKLFDDKKKYEKVALEKPKAGEGTGKERRNRKTGPYSDDMEEDEGHVQTCTQQ